MIIDPLSFVPVEIERRRAAVRAVRTQPRRGAPPVKRRQRPRRPVMLRLAAWATGRTALV